jgi:tetratricopeptide (TPR) repeat protein
MHSARSHHPSAIEDALMASAVLGAGLPFEAERHLRQAGFSYHLDDVAEHHLHMARQVAPEHAAVLIGLYRFYFYKGRLREALGIARTCLAIAARDLNIAGDWHLVGPGDAAFGAYENALPRFYLFTLKGYAYLHMRLGDMEEGRAAVTKLLEIEPTDKVGARVLLEVLHRVGADDDD